MTTKGKVLVLVSSGRGLPLKDGGVYTGAGYYLNELTVPVRALMKEGYEITFANPKGNAPPYLQLANIWMILNVGGGPTPDKPTVTLSVPDPNHINSFMNFRVADIQACYELWKSRGAEFITAPIPKYGEIRCYIRDPDGYLIEVGQSTTLKYG